MLQSIQHTKFYPNTNQQRTIPIAPAAETRNTSSELQDKRKYLSKSNLCIGAQATSILRRNARERNRVKQVNDGFSELRKRLPSAVIAALSGGPRRGSGKKLSKVDTLKMVVEYIKHLQNVIDESDAALGISRKTTTETEAVDEGVFGGRNSPYSDSVPSPADSEFSSGVSSSFSSKGCYSNYEIVDDNLSSMYEGDLLDAISWWQEK